MEFKQYTQEEFEQRYHAWRTGRLLIQEAFAELSPDGREFVKTGITAEEWDNAFPENEPVGESGRFLG
jgi:hypothetical protein